MNGKILTRNRGLYLVKYQSEVGLFRLTGTMLKREGGLLVGDDVELDIDAKLIVDSLPRSNQLYRPKIANIDQLMIVMSAKQPEFSLLLVEKFLTYANLVSAKPFVIITKIDLLDSEEITANLEALTSLHVNFSLVDNHHQKGLEEVKQLLIGKTTALMGQTGVGKSSLINALFPTFEREIGSYSLRGGRGRHQTKEVILLPLEQGGFIADTPGFSSFSLPLIRSELSTYYPGFKQYLGKCKYNDCLHLHEDGCQLKADVAKMVISSLSYDNYVKILLELPERRENY